MSADREAAIREALDLGLQAWRNTDVRETFHAANDSLNALLANLATTREREEKLREALRDLVDHTERFCGERPIEDSCPAWLRARNTLAENRRLREREGALRRAALADGEGET